MVSLTRPIMSRNKLDFTHKCCIIIEKQKTPINRKYAKATDNSEQRNIVLLILLIEEQSQQKE